MSRYFRRTWIRPTLAVLIGGSATASGLWAAVAAKPVTNDNPKNSDRGSERDRIEVPPLIVAPQPTTTWDNDWDRRKPDKDAENKPTATRHIILVRHGQYNLDAATPEEKFLTPLGRRQVDITGQRLSELGVPFDRVVYSTMVRATESGQIVSKHIPNVPVETCSLIREGGPIPPVPAMRSYRPERYQYFADGARIEAGFRKYFHRASVDQTQDSYDLLICHANVIRYYVCRALQLTPEAWLRFGMNNGGITWITIRPNGRVGLRLYNDCGFMPIDMLTTN